MMNESGVKELILRVLDRYERKYPSMLENYSLLELLCLREAGYDIPIDTIESANFDADFPKLSSLDRAIRDLKPLFDKKREEQRQRDIDEGRQKTLKPEAWS